MTDLISSLRALAKSEHDDLSIAGDAANEIERLRDVVQTLAARIMNGRIDMATSTKARADVALLAAEKFARAALEKK